MYNKRAAKLYEKIEPINLREMWEKSAYWALKMYSYSLNPRNLFIRDFCKEHNIGGTGQVVKGVEAWKIASQEIKDAYRDRTLHLKEKLIDQGEGFPQLTIITKGNKKLDKEHLFRHFRPVGYGIFLKGKPADASNTWKAWKVLSDEEKDRLHRLALEKRQEIRKNALEIFGSEKAVEILYQMRHCHLFRLEDLFFDDVLPDNMKYFDNYMYKEMKMYNERKGNIVEYFNHCKSRWYLTLTLTSWLIKIGILQYRVSQLTIRSCYKKIFKK